MYIFKLNGWIPNIYIKPTFWFIFQSKPLSGFFNGEEKHEWH